MCLSSSVRRESIAETCRRGRQSASRERITSFPPSLPPLRFPLSSLSRRAARTTPASPSTTLLQTIHLNPIANAPVLHPLHHPHYHFHPIPLPIQSSHPASRPLLSGHHNLPLQQLILIIHLLILIRFKQVPRLLDPFPRSIRSFYLCAHGNPFAQRLLPALAAEGGAGGEYVFACANRLVV